MSVIYEPKGAALEYCELALNIYSGCTNGCFYCFAPNVLHKNKKEFHNRAILRQAVTPEQVYNEIVSKGFKNRTIQLCFTCDPYPNDTNTQPTRNIIKAIKKAGANVQILTKNGRLATRDFDLLTPSDSFGVTLTARESEKSQKWEPFAETPTMRIASLASAKQCGIKTWVSFEPVVSAKDSLYLLREVISNKLADVVKIGKLNYFNPEDPINWAEFGEKAENICIEAEQSYCIKNALRKEMKNI